MTFDLKNRQQLLVVVAIACVALLAGDRLIIRPLVQSWKDRASEVATLKASCARGTQLLRREQTLTSSWENMRTRMLTNDASVAQAKVCSAFDRWAQASRVTITSVKPQWKRMADEQAMLECRVDASGNLAAVTRFLYDLERDDMALNIQDLNLTARDDGGQQLDLVLQITGLVLSQRSPQ